MPSGSGSCATWRPGTNEAKKAAYLKVASVPRITTIDPARIAFRRAFVFAEDGSTELRVRSRCPAPYVNSVSAARRMASFQPHER